MDIFDVYITYVSWGDSGKNRPVLVIELKETIVSVFSITTQYENKNEMISSNYFKINDWSQAGLFKQSYIDTNMIRDIPISAFDNKAEIGRLSENDVLMFIEFLSKRR